MIEEVRGSRGAAVEAIRIQLAPLLLAQLYPHNRHGQTKA